MHIIGTGIEERTMRMQGPYFMTTTHLYCRPSTQLSSKSACISESQQRSWDPMYLQSLFMYSCDGPD